MRITDLDLNERDIQDLASLDAIAALFDRLGYDISGRVVQTAGNLGISRKPLARRIQACELLATEVGPFQVYAFVLASLARSALQEIARQFRDRPGKYLLVFADPAFDLVVFGITAARDGEFAFPTLTVERRKPTRAQVRTVRRLTWTEGDHLAQARKIQAAFADAAWSEEFFLNRGLFADHYLKERLPHDHKKAWTRNIGGEYFRAKELYVTAREAMAEPDEAATRKTLLEPMFRLLGFEPRSNKSAQSADLAPDYFLETGSSGVRVPCLAYTFHRNLDGRDPVRDPHTPNENPSASVVQVLADHSPGWVVMTNGRLWRLYSTLADSRATTYYEVDLDVALFDPHAAGDAFRYFWLLFRGEAFVPGEDGRCFLDRVFLGSREYARRLGDSLRDEVFLRTFPALAQGILGQGRGEAGPVLRPGPADLAAAHDATLRLLYRLLFVLYAEARDLLPVLDPGYQSLSLRRLKHEIADKGGDIVDERDEALAIAFSDREYGLHERLNRLFWAIGNGDPDMNLPAYAGGLFEDRDAPYAGALVPDRHLALAIDGLARAEDDRTHALAFVDYRTLGVRQLGSIYEGLLEFRLEVADRDLAVRRDKGREVFTDLHDLGPDARERLERAGKVIRAGTAYLVNDRGERRASGSYYTPEYVVRFIVRRTLDPLLDRLFEAMAPKFRRVQAEYRRFDRQQKEFKRRGIEPRHPDQRDLVGADLVERFFDLRVLDPAMGSGHFLVQAVDYLTDRMLEFLNRFPENPILSLLGRTRKDIQRAMGEQGVELPVGRLDDISLLRRHVLKRCLFGVDKNPLAVELAKVSLWLHSFTLGAPLSFLDHHLRCGDSLAGSSVDEVRSAVETDLFGGQFEGLLNAAQGMLAVGRLSDVTVDQARQSRETFTGASAMLTPFAEVLDLWTSQHFGNEAAKGFFLGARLPPIGRGWMDALGKRDRETASRGLEIARARRFLHWELAFPEAWYGPSGPLPDPGFDAVIGNPPYVRQEAITELKPFLKAAYPEVYSSTADLYCFFYARGRRVMRRGGRFGMITQDKFMKADYGKKLRNMLAHDAGLDTVVLFGGLPVFADATVYPAVVIFDRDRTGRPVRHLKVGSLGPRDEPWLGALFEREARDADPSGLAGPNWSLGSGAEAAVLNRMRVAGRALGDYLAERGVQIHYGIKTGLNKAFFIDRRTRDRLIAKDPRSAEVIKPLAVGDDVRRYRVLDRDRFLIFTRRGIDIGRYPAIEQHLAQWRDELEPRRDRKSPGPGRKPGPYKWYEIQDNVAYYHEFEGPKIVYPDMLMVPRFALDTHGLYCSNTCYMINLADMGLVAFLNSPITFWFASKITAKAKGGRSDGTSRLFTSNLRSLRIPRFSDAEWTRLSDLARRRTGIEATLPVPPTRGRRKAPAPPREAKDIDREIDAIVARAFGLADRDLDLVLSDER